MPESTSIEIKRDHALAPLTTWRIGGPADHYAEPTNPAQLAGLLLLAQNLGLPVLALGGASNMLISDLGYRGLVIHYLDDTMDQLFRADQLTLRVGAGQILSRLARRLSREGWAGLEWAEGIPGTLGGAIAGNAGAYGGQISQLVQVVEVVAPDGKLSEMPAVACDFGYRSSRFKERGLSAGFVVAATLALQREDPALLIRRMREIGATRKRNSPTGSSCGSVFQNPPGEFAGRLVELAGLLGAEEGPAQISTRHGNYIVNRGGATATQVRRLIERARAAVRSAHGIELQLEVRLVGFEEEGA